MWCLFHATTVPFASKMIVPQYEFACMPSNCLWLLHHIHFHRYSLLVYSYPSTSSIRTYQIPTDSAHSHSSSHQPERHSETYPRQSGVRFTGYLVQHRVSTKHTHTHECSLEADRGPSPLPPPGHVFPNTRVVTTGVEHSTMS